MLVTDGIWTVLDEGVKVGTDRNGIKIIFTGLGAE